MPGARVVNTAWVGILETKEKKWKNAKKLFYLKQNTREIDKRLHRTVWHCLVVSISGYIRVLTMEIILRYIKFTILYRIVII